MKVHAFLGILLLVGATWADAAQDPIPACLGHLQSAIEAVGDSRAGEVASDRSELKDILSSLERRARDVATERASLESDMDRLDFHNRDRDRRLQQLEREELALQNDEADLNRRHAEHEADLRAFNVACAGGAPVPASQIASCNAWHQRVNTRAAQGSADAKTLKERRAEIERRRETITNDTRQDAGRIGELLKRHTRVDRGTAKILGECVAGQSRALALRQIVNSPSRTIEHQSPSAVADKVVSGLFKSMAKEGALKAMEGRTMVKVLAMVGLKAQPVGTAYAVADVFADVAIAGVDQRVTEVTRNLFLVGDYAAVMKTMVDRKGADATRDPSYIAMRKELERLRSEMPSNSVDVALQGLGSSAAIGEAFAALAGTYASKQVAHTGNVVVRHLNNAERQTLGKGGVKFFREAINAVAKGSADETAKNGAKAMIESFNSAHETGEGQ
jgi:hypothetical protein